MNLQLPSEHQRLFVLIGVGVIALAGLFLVTRMGGESSGPSTASPPAKSSPAKPGTGSGDQPKGGSTKGGTKSTSGSQSAAKPSNEAYVNCVQQATDTAALEKCQALVP